MVYRKGSYREADVSFGLFEVLCYFDLAKSGYRTLSKNISEFAKINEMPIPLDIRRIDEGYGIEAAFIKNEAPFTTYNLHTFSYGIQLGSMMEFLHPVRSFIQCYSTPVRSVHHPRDQKFTQIFHLWRQS
jgi:hypothetical protein